MISLKVPLFVVSLFLLNTVYIYGCSCGEFSPCRTAATADVVFIGTVTNKESIKTGKKITYGNQTFDEVDNYSTLKIDEIFIGEKTNNVKFKDIKNTCDFPFEEGKTYFVIGYFDEDEKTYYTSLCSRTSPISEAQELIDYYRKGSYKKASFEGFIEKQVYYDPPTVEFFSKEEPINRAKITLESDLNTFHTFSNKKGFFLFDDLPEGTYTVTTDTDVNFSALDKESITPKKSWKVNIPKRGCLKTWFAARPTAEISGQITGKLEDNPWIYIIFAKNVGKKEGSFLSARIEPDGNFKFTFLPKGAFYLGFNLYGGASIDSPYPEYFYPGTTDVKKASLINLKEGQKVSNLNFEHPQPVEKRTITGIAFWEDGKPAINTTIELYNIKTDYREGNPVWTDKEGRFSIVGMEGQTYKLSALIKKGIPLVNTKPMIIKVGKENPPVTYTIIKP